MLIYWVTAADAGDVWYDIYVRMEGDAIVVYAGRRGFEMTKIVDDTTGVAASTDRLQFMVYGPGASEFLFDDVRVMTRYGDDTTLAEFGGHDHLIHGQNPSNIETTKLEGIKYHVPRTPSYAYWLD